MRSVLPIGLLLAGCATAPVTWVRADGNAPTAEQLTLDRTICQGEMQKSNLTNTVKGGVAFDANGVYDPKTRALSQVFTGCMAQRGYIKTNN